MFVRQLLAEFGRSPHGEALTRAYVSHLAQRVPLIYCVVIIDIAALSLNFAGSAPPLLTIYAPLALALIGFSRALYWLPAMVARRALPKIQRDLQVMNRVGFVAAIPMIVWGMALYTYGNEAQQSLIHYIFAVTCFTTILGLAQSPATALSVAVATILPSTFFFAFHDHPNAVAIAVVQFVVTVLLLVVTSGYHRDFVKLELSRQQLARRERETSLLAENNRHNATVDSLTGALNRRAILARLESALLTSGGAPVWLALVDLDGFKHVNDTYGHAAGDTVLCTVSRRLAEMEDAAAFGRLGGDEFAILLDGGLSAEAATAALQRLSAALRQPIEHNGVTLRLAASIGFSQNHGHSVEDCLERSDAALYKAKDIAEGAVVFFTEDDERELCLKTVATRRFNDCSLEDRLQLVYQPMVDVDTRGIVGFEAFARWSPDGEAWLTPDRFLPFAQATGRTGELTRIVLARALAECRAWEWDRDLSINLSPRDVLRDGVDEVLGEIVRLAGAPPERILLEVTERALHRDPRRAADHLARFRARGFRIALDDFGAGWSSLSHVRNLPLDRIKIDQALAGALAGDPGARAIAGTIVGLAWQMGLECTIEGIEDERQAETARALGLRIMQGYHFGRPAEAVAVLASLERAA